MSTWNVDDEQKAQLPALPETGMGFQLVEATFWGDRKQFLVFNATSAVDLSPLDLDFSSDPAAISRNELRIIHEMQRTTNLHFAAPGPHSFQLLGSRVAASATGATLTVVAATPSSLIKHTVLANDRVSHRFSAFHPDRRVDPVSGDFVPGLTRVLNRSYRSSQQGLPQSDDLLF